MITIRTGRPDDADRIMEVHRRSILDLAKSHYSAAELNSWTAKLRPALYRESMARGETYLVAESDDGRMAAFCSWQEDEIKALYVHPEWARGGLGGDLLVRAEAVLMANGHQRIQITASLSGLAFYKAKGYRVVAHTKWHTRGGLVLASLRLEKALTS